MHGQGWYCAAERSKVRFAKGSDVMQVWQVQMQIITQRGQWSSSTGIPSFWVFASNIDDAINNARTIAVAFVNIADPRPTKISASGTVCAAERVNFNGYGSIFGLLDRRGDGYRSFEITLHEDVSEPVLAYAAHR